MTGSGVSAQLSLSQRAPWGLGLSTMGRSPIYHLVCVQRLALPVTWQVGGSWARCYQGDSLGPFPSVWSAGRPRTGLTKAGLRRQDQEMAGGVCCRPYCWEVAGGGCAGWSEPCLCAHPLPFPPSSDLSSLGGVGGGPGEPAPPSVPQSSQ